MHFSEDDLREALKRKDPGPGFTQRVMAGVNQGQTDSAPSERQAPGWWTRVWGWRPVLAGAVAVLLLVVGWMGYMRYQHEQELRQAKLAEQQVKLALRITNKKMSQVLQRVSAAQPRESNIRRQSL
jgi:hypothetical protein